MTIFLLGFVFSFIGSIPPGTLNLSVVQLSLNGHKSAALRFAMAAAIIEFPYAYLAVAFEEVITSAPWVTTNFRLLAAVVILTLGVINIITHVKSKSGGAVHNIQKGGFRKGIILSILNPLAIPFWIGITAYLKNQEWLYLNSTWDSLVYVSAISLGTLSLLVTFTFIGSKLSGYFKRNQLLNLLPGLVFLILGVYALFQYIING